MHKYYKKYIKYKIKYNRLKKIVGGTDSIPKPLKKLISVLKFGTQQIPFIGEIEALLVTIMSTKDLFENIMTILNGKEIKQLLTITLENGQEDLVEQVNTIYDNMSEQVQEAICAQIPDVYESIETFICNWISTIPHIGPATALIIQNSNALNFDSFSNIYKKLPDNMKEIFEKPETLVLIINNFEINIKKLLNKKVDKDSEQTNEATEEPDEELEGGGIFSDMKKKALNKTKNLRAQIKKRALDMKDNIADIGYKLISNYFIKILNPAVKLSSKALKLFIPLFFSLLYLKDKCA